ncbi:AMP-binding protein [Pseudonocardia spinosispora]|uniref:AMP-binding protein n=1 Tax=Pseudonocardia spinosispora TaxID=103441 RepID=UPI000425B6A8|nr:AMP-binding protein [Pseudonocardia spinosispora]
MLVFVKGMITPGDIGNAVQQAVELTWGLGLLAKAGVVAPMRPDRALGIAEGYLRWGISMATGYAAGASRHPDRPALIDDRGVLTFAEVNERSERLARALADRGVDEDTSIAVLCRNHRGPVEVAVAAARLGADVALLNTSLSASTIGEVLREQGSTVLVADEEFSDSLDKLPSTCRLITAWTEKPTRDSLDELITHGGDAVLPLRPPQGKLIVLTSGTTGTPKGATRPSPKSWAPAGAILSRIPFQAGEPMFVAPPLFHTWGFAAMQLAMMLGAPAVLRRKFDPADALRSIAEHRCGTVIAVPVMLSRILELPKAEIERYDVRLRVVAASGSALPGNLATEFMDQFGDVLYNLYGSTEVSWVSIADPTDLRADPRTAGKAPWGTKLEILDDDGNPVPEGEVGRVFVGNGMMFEGYTREGAEVEMHEGLMTTGDLGRLDENGRLFLSGRGDSMIVSGGENVYPGPVEDLLAEQSEVREAAVIGVDDEKFGQRLAAYVVLADGAKLDADGVRALVKDRLSRFSVPRDVVFLDELPRNPTGKVLARELPKPDES